MKLLKAYINILNENLYHGSKRGEINWDERGENPDYNMLGYGIYLTDDKNEAKHYAELTKGDSKFIHIFKPINANIVNWLDKIDDVLLSTIKNIPNLTSIQNLNDINIDDGLLKIDNGTIEWDYVDEPLPDWVKKDNGKAGYFFIEYDKNYKSVRDVIYGLSKNDVIELASKYNLRSLEIDDNIFYGLKSTNGELNNDNILSSIVNFYTFLYYKFGSTKKASQYFSKLGVDGVNMKIDTSDYDYNIKPIVTVIYNPKKFKIIKSIKIF